MSRSRRRMLTALPVLALALTGAGCQRETRPTVLHGLLVEVEAASFLLVRSLTLRTDNGDLIPMIAEGDIGMTPGHLREHMALGEPVSITVRYDADLVIATRIDDRVADASARPLANFTRFTMEPTGTPARAGFFGEHLRVSVVRRRLLFFPSSRRRRDLTLTDLHA